LAPDQSSGLEPGTFVTYIHTLTNTGNYTDTFDLSFTSSQGWAEVSPTLPITLPSGGKATVEVTVRVPAGTGLGTVDVTVVTATSRADPGVSSSATDVTTVGYVGGVILEPDRSSTARPDTVASYVHTLTNNGNGSDTFDIAHVSSQGWTVSYDTPIVLDSKQTAQVAVSIMVPAGVPSGVVDETVITATSRVDPAVFDTAEDTTTVGQVGSVVLEPDLSSTSSPDTVATYVHTLTNNGNGTDTFDLTHGSSQGWTVSYDTPIVVESKQSVEVVVSIMVPAGVPGGVVDETLITATSRADATAFDTATDTTTVAVEGWKVHLPVVLRSVSP
jgi:uncharacterized membrane protein